MPLGVAIIYVIMVKPSPRSCASATLSTAAMSRSSSDRLLVWFFIGVAVPFSCLRGIESSRRSFFWVLVWGTFRWLLERGARPGGDAHGVAQAFQPGTALEFGEACGGKALLEV